MESGYRLVGAVANRPHAQEAKGWTVLATTVPPEACADAAILPAYPAQHTTGDPGLRGSPHPAAIAPVWLEQPERMAA